mmetsp:Transcript_17240/g.22721  ORF Transcript_17240/g.22721 Transcript_17240/m.22721 type:complete len:156 (+) Transcript_17240:99-566(+)|eukprot:CAMPEP_0117736374 /NCGR_PEP_ID=MMETSP0947-20121206/1890_1 /TAXON_ID=44440 /ORGANISM="Chattonella subsalsa, Strain CCMP2191" /LENGTH=155 /DNA_ID=CAMNT_0005551649 /DNA_START=99 /DNA_END=566 /DNA_ORIENTATION=+
MALRIALLRSSLSSQVARSATSTNKAALYRLLSTYYTPTHEYIKVEGDVGTIGITDFAQSQLGDVVYCELPEIDTDLEKGEVFGSVESVKAASDVYSPVEGTVVEANEALEDKPGLVNESAMGDGWFMKVKIANAAELDELLDEAAYKALCEEDH